MGLIFSSTEMTTHGYFAMPGVPADMAEQTFRDIESAPSFVPHLLEVEFLRGNAPSTVGACWNQRRVIGGREVVIRKNITRMSNNPFTVNTPRSISMENIAMPRIWPRPLPW